MAYFGKTSYLWHAPDKARSQVIHYPREANFNVPCAQKKLTGFLQLCRGVMTNDPLLVFSETTKQMKCLGSAIGDFVETLEVLMIRR